MTPLFYSSAPRPEDEQVRQAAVDASGFSNAIDHAALVDIAERAIALFGVKMAAISIVDHNRQWFAVEIGLGVRGTSRAISFCAHAILEPDEVLCVHDTVDDPRFAGNPLVLSRPNIRFYTGAPLIDPQGQPLGTLCVLDDRRHERPTADTLEALAALARQAVAAGAAARL